MPAFLLMAWPIIRPLLPVIAVGAALAGAWAWADHRATLRERARWEAANARARIEAQETRNDVEDRVAREPDPVGELRRQWQAR